MQTVPRDGAHGRGLRNAQCRLGSYEMFLLEVKMMNGFRVRWWRVRSRRVEV